MTYINSRGASSFQSSLILNITRQYIPIKIHIDSFIKFVHISYFTKLGKEEGVETHPVRIF